MGSADHFYFFKYYTTTNKKSTTTNTPRDFFLHNFHILAHIQNQSLDAYPRSLGSWGTCSHAAVAVVAPNRFHL